MRRMFQEDGFMCLQKFCVGGSSFHYGWKHQRLSSAVVVIHINRLLPFTRLIDARTVLGVIVRFFCRRNEVVHHSGVVNYHRYPHKPPQHESSLEEPRPRPHVDEPDSLRNSLVLTSGTGVSFRHNVRGTVLSESIQPRMRFRLSHPLRWNTSVVWVPRIELPVERVVPVEVISQVQLGVLVRGELHSPHVDA